MAPRRHVESASWLEPPNAAAFALRLSCTAREPPEPCAQVVLVDDAVPIEHAPRLVSGELHGHGIGHPGTHEIADGRPAEVVRDLAGHTCRFTGCPLRASKIPDQHPVSLEHERAKNARGRQILVLPPLLLDHFDELRQRTIGKHSALVILRRSR